MDALIIGGHYSADHEDSLHHCDDFRLTVNGIPMSIPNLVDYFRDGRTFCDAQRRRFLERRRPYRQVYYSALHLWNLLTHHGFEADILNCHDPSDPRRLRLYAEKPRCVILSTTFMNMEAVRRVVADIREHLPETWIVVGGCYVRHSYLVWQKQHQPHYSNPAVRNTYFFTSEIPILGVDAWIYDDHGEEALLGTMERLRTGSRPGDLPNTAVPAPPGSGQRWHFNAAIPESFSMDRHAIHWSAVPRRLLSSVVPFSITYGCPFHCRFCNFSQKKLSQKSMDVIFQELRELATHNVVERVWFTDDNFLITPQRVEEFCERFLRERFPFSWMSFIRASSITQRSAELLKSSNACLLILGLESGSQQVLHNMGKKDSVDNYVLAMKALMENDLDTEISFIFGYPGETADTVQETIDFLNQCPARPAQVNYLYLFKFSLMPLSPIFEESLRSRWGLQGAYTDWRHRTMSSDQVEGFMRQVAMAARSTVFNYIDPASRLNREELVALMRLRDDLGRAILRGPPEGPEVRDLWDRLETTIRRHFL
ncbi:MAG TPA: radical SAM protein [Phycisphaerae bacterium]|nr:radical SAM protein [Phycisphaerae bacterium]